MSNQNQRSVLSLGQKPGLTPVVNDADKKQNTAAPTEIKAGETKFGKTILIKRTKLGRTFTIAFEEGGKLPTELEGEFTRASDAVAAVATYKARNPALRDRLE